jgi:hypothetical protein
MKLSVPSVFAGKVTITQLEKHNIPGYGSVTLSRDIYPLAIAPYIPNSMRIIRLRQQKYAQLGHPKWISSTKYIGPKKNSCGSGNELPL